MTKTLSAPELTRKVVRKLLERGALRKSYAEVFEKTAFFPSDVLFSNAVDPEEFALVVSEITEIPTEKDPRPVSFDSFFFDEGEKVNLEEVFSTKRIPIEGGVGILYPSGELTGNERIISLTNFRDVLSSYVKTSDVKVEKLITAGKYADALALILVQAVAEKASDVHVDPFGRDGLCEFRIDGEVRVFCSLKGKGEEIINSLFSLANTSHDRSFYQATSLRLSGEQLKQETFQEQEVVDRLPFLRGVDFRIEVVPTGNGRSVVIRLLDKTKTFWKLENLGLQEVIVEKLSLLLPKRGVLLVTGETGSGKTTTCYALLNKLDAVRKKLVTIEDPIELLNPFWRQLQRREGGDYELSFENLLSSVLRQDPDVIFVGEVRSSETASLLFQAANTGHSVVSTLHTNSVYDTVVRLADLLKDVMSEGEIKLRLSSFLKGVLSQRLLKRVCPECGEWKPLPKLPPHLLSVCNQMGIKYHLVGKGCEKCGYTGYRGRVLVSEFVEFTKEVAEAVLRGNLTRYEFDKLIEEQGVRTILKDALFKVKTGETNLYQVVERL